MSERCCICGHDDIKISMGASSRDEQRCECPDCGIYYVDSFVARQISHNHDFLLYAPALAWERRKQGRDNYHLICNDRTEDIYVGDTLFTADFPKSYPEILDRVLLNLANEANFSPREILYPHAEFRPFFIVASGKNGEQEKKDLLNILQEEGFLKWEENVPLITAITLTLSGIKKALELNKGSQGNSEHAFIAMWFSPTLDPFAEALKQAIKFAGYVPHVVKDEPHNDYIMNKVLNLINESRFVIADITSVPEEIFADGHPSKGVRGGVYFEAGYALGKGMPVILTCREDADAKARIHFDLAQRNTIFWKQNSDSCFTTNGRDLIQQLKDHILFTVGKGPLLMGKI